MPRETPSAAGFQVQEFSRFFGWQSSGNTIGPTFAPTLLPNSLACRSTGQHCFAIRAAFQHDPTNLTAPRYIDVYPGREHATDPDLILPHIAASYDAGSPTTVLEYAFPNAIRYVVYENHGGQTFVAYDGPASQITVNRILSAPNQYRVVVQAGVRWYYSQWLVTQGETLATATPSSTPSPTATPTLAGTPACAPAGPGLNNCLVAYWKLDEASGTRVDATGRGNDLLPVNAPGSDSGIINDAVALSRSSLQYLYHNDTDDLSFSSSFTVSAWVYLTDKSNHMDIASKWDEAGGLEYVLMYQNGPDRLMFFVNISGNYVQVSADSSVPLNTWIHVLAWVDVTAGTINIQVNGGQANVAVQTIVVNDTPIQFRLGARDQAEINAWDGRIDEVGFWKRALTAEERAYLYNDGQGRPYPFSP